MNSNDKRFKHTNVDGQMILFPNEEAWKILQSEPVIDGITLRVLYLLWSILEFVQQYHELHLGLGHSSQKCKDWRPYVFLEIDSNLQRVHLERLQCSYCGWKGMTAYPLDVDIYLGDGVTEKTFDLLRNAEKYPVLPCPKCGERLPRHPIWLEPGS
ncbi:MAG: hypothetical protein HC815_34060 [Richelia sp. RM1_1_1]|nr:hypothetical protein [Richelia sp. RM1_1_1]